MGRIRRRVAFAMAPLVALALAGVLRAGSGGRSGESISASGTFAIQQSPDAKQQVPLEAIYWIDYPSAKLFATTPDVSRTAAGNGVIGAIAVRDLVDDFQLKPGVQPHFLMNTASLGALGGGTSVLLVIETSTKQTAVYWTYTKSTGINARTEFELIQVKPYARPASTGDATPLKAISTSGSVIIQTSMDKKLIPLDAVYWLESDEKTARLFTAIPEVRKTATTTQMVGEVASRDVFADFRLKSGTAPNFLISTASLGAVQMGMSALFVIETTTNQIAVYRAYPKSTALGAKPEIELLKVRAYTDGIPPLPPSSR